MPQLTFNYGKILTLCIRARNNVLCIKQQLQRLALLDAPVLERMEIIIVDNDSTDGTQTAVKQFEGRVPFKYVSNTDNLSQDNSYTFAFNQAIAVKSKYIWMLDARNVVRVEHFDQFLQALEKNNFGMVHLSKGGRLRKSLVHYVDIDDFLQSVSINIIDISRNIIRTDFIRGYNPREFGAGSGVPTVPLLLHVALAGKQNAVYNSPLFFDARINFVQEARNPVRTYIKNLLSIYESYDDESRPVSLSPVTIMKLKNRVSDYLLPVIVRLFVLRREVKGLDAKASRQIVKEYLGWRPVVSAIRKCVSRKLWGRVCKVIFFVIRKLITWILAGITMLICNTVVTKAWTRFRNNLTTYRFCYRVHTGKGCSVEYPVLVEGRNIHIGSGFAAKPGLHLESINTGNYTPKITIGDGVKVERNVRVGAIRDVRIGNNVLISQDVLITDFQCGKTDVESLHIVPIDRQLVINGSVIIEDNVVIGPKAVILSGVTIGKGAVVAAGAVVTHNVPPHTVAKGVPARCQ